MSQLSDAFVTTIKGHVKIVDDLGNVLLDKDNRIHPQNMARAISRGLAHEFNGQIYRMAFGNGGTLVNEAYTVTYRTPNDGQPPDPNTWNSRLYHETYSEIVDETINCQTYVPAAADPASILPGTVVDTYTLNPLVTYDPGSADQYTGLRPGGGAVPSSDPPITPNVSGPGTVSRELGVISEVIVTCVLNKDEPKAEFITDNFFPNTQRTENLPSTTLPPTVPGPAYADFVFDEIGFYTSGAPAVATQGYQFIDIGTRVSTDPTGLLPSTGYRFSIAVDSAALLPAPIYTTISFTTPASGSGPNGEILYGDLVAAINSGDPVWNGAWGGVSPLPGGTVVLISDNTGLWAPYLPIGTQTYGYLMFVSGTSGITSAIAIDERTSSGFINSINPPVGGTLLAPVNGKNAGVQNNVVFPEKERERLLTHIIFSPILKSANRALTIEYSLTISIARTPPNNCANL